jgi:hypothetical protein
MALALTLGPMPVVRGEPPDPPLDLLAAAWWEYGDRFESPPFTRPWGWWQFCDVPDDLRERPRVLEPVDDDRDLPEHRDRRDRVRRELDRRRRAWLVAHPESLDAAELALVAGRNGARAATTQERTDAEGER